MILEQELNATCKVLPFGKQEISTVAVCSGGGANYAFLGEAIEKDVKSIPVFSLCVLFRKILIFFSSRAPTRLATSRGAPQYIRPYLS